MQYLDALDLQRSLHREIADGARENTLLLLEHPSVFTAGKRTQMHERPSDGSLVIDVDRGGWGAVLGGIFYSFASTRMQDLTQQESFKSIPEWIGGPIAEPALLLGLIFILIVMFSPGGLSGAYYRLRLKALTRKSS